MDSDILKKYKESGRIAATALQHGAKMIKIGVKLVDVCDAVEAKIKKLGGGCAFPAQSSRNEIAAHYCPPINDETTYQEGDIVKLDCGVEIDGFVTDNAVTVDLGKHTELVKASRDALNAAIKLCTPGTQIGTIGNAIEEAIQGYGFSPIRNLSGHGIGKFIVHQAPSIPNFDNSDPNVLIDCQTIAIEPFATNGAGMITELGTPTVFMVAAKKPVRSQFARELLKTIQIYNGLPFALRWLSRIHGETKTNFGIRELLNAGIIRGYPPLPDMKKGLVSQAEHSVIVGDKPIILTNVDED